MQKSASSARENDSSKTTLPKIDQQKTKKMYKVKPTFQMKISKPYTRQAKRVPLYIHEDHVKEPPSLFKKERSEPKVFQFDAGFFKGPKAKKPKQEKIVVTEEEEEIEYRLHSRFKLYPRKPLSELKEADYDKNEKQKKRRHRHNQDGEEIENEYYENEEEELDELNRSRKLMLKEEEDEEKRRLRRKQKREEEARRKAEEEEARKKAEEEEAKRKAEEEEARRKAEEEEARRRAEEEARRKAEEEEARRKAEEEEARRKAEEEEARKKAEEEEARRKAEEEEEARRKAEEEEAKRKAEEEEARKRAEEEVARRVVEEEERRKAAEEEEAKRKAEEEEEAKRKAEEEEEARKKAEEEEARKKAEEEEARRKAEEEEEARRKAEEEEAKRKAEEEEARKKAEEEEARKKAEEEAKKKAEEEEAKRKAEEEARKKAEEEEAKRKAEEEAKKKAEEEEAKRKAEAEEAKRKAEEEARKKAEEEEEAKKKAEEEARKKAEEEEARKKAEEEEAKRKADEEAKKKAEEESRTKFGDTNKLNPVLDNLIEDNANKIAGKSQNPDNGQTTNDGGGDSTVDSKTRKIDLENDENSADQNKSTKSSKKKLSSVSTKSKNDDNQTGNDDDEQDDEEEEAKESGRDDQQQQEKLSEEQLQELPPPLPKSSYILGIDFGTSVTRFAIYKDNNLDTRISEFSLPSSVAFNRYTGQPYFNFMNPKKKSKNNNDDNKSADEKDKKNNKNNFNKNTFNGKTVKGGFSATGHLHLCLNDDEDPDDILTNDDYIVVPAIKRLLGREISQETAKNLPFELEVSGKKKRERIKITDTDSLSFEQVAALILAEGKRIVEDQIKEDVSDAVLCVPGFFSNNQKTSMKDAATIAGFNVVKLVSETIAVVTAMKTNSGKHIQEITKQEINPGENNGILDNLLSNTLSSVVGDSTDNNNNNNATNNNNNNGTNNNNNNANNSNSNNNSNATSNNNSGGASNSKGGDGSLQGVLSNTLAGVLGGNNNSNNNGNSNGNNNNGSNNNSNNSASNNTNSNGSSNNNANSSLSGKSSSTVNGSKNGTDSSKNGDDDGEDSQKKAIVVEFGAGNLDTSIVGFGKDTVTIDKSSGDTSLGGMDIDMSIRDLVLKKIPKEKADQIKDSPAAMRTLMIACENFRISHSNKTSNQDGENKTNSNNKNASTSTKGDKNDDNSEAGSVTVEGILDDFDLKAIITESEYTNIMSPVCKRLTSCLQDLFKHNKTKANDIKELIFVGGVMKTPMIRNVITNYITDSIKNDNNKGTDNKDTKTNDTNNTNNNINGGNDFQIVYINSQGVMLGAAIQGAICRGDTSIDSVKIRNALFLSIGFSLADGTTSILIPRGKALPCSKSTKTTTFKDNQRNVTFDIVEGERKMAEDNIKLGNVCVKGIEKAPRGVPQIEIKMAIDEEGILLVEARDMKTGAKIKTKMTSKTNLSKDEVKKMLASAEINKQRDNYRRKQAEAKSKLKFYLLQMESKGKELNNQQFLDLIDKYYDWIDENDDAKPSEYIDMYKKSKKELSSYIKNLQNA